MKLAEVLERKGGRAVTVAQTATVADAIRTMYENRVGSVVITSTADILMGIFTERDVFHLCADGKGAELETLFVSDFMTRDVVVGTPDDRIDDVLNLMTQGRFRRLPVVVDDKILGVVSIGDLVKVKLEQTAGEAEALRQYITS